MTFQVPERHRVMWGPMASHPMDGNNGAFLVPPPAGHTSVLMVVASDGAGWEHVSVSLPTRCPTWEEMAYVRSVFWSPDVAVMQLHPPASEYVNNHSFCLHLWRPLDAEIPLPPSLLVGFKDAGRLA